MLKYYITLCCVIISIYYSTDVECFELFIFIYYMSLYRLSCSFSVCSYSIYCCVWFVQLQYLLLCFGLCSYSIYCVLFRYGVMFLLLLTHVLTGVLVTCIAVHIVPWIKDDML